MGGPLVFGQKSLVMICILFSLKYFWTPIYNKDIATISELENSVFIK